MPKPQPKPQGMGLPTAAMLIYAILGAVLVGFSFVIIKSWPQPPSIAPYMGFEGGFWWGLVVGAISGWIIGFLVDDKHFSKHE